MDGKEQWPLVNDTTNRLCGWCMTGYHDSCKPRIDFYEKTWYCTCIKCRANDANDKNDTTTQGASEDENEQSSATPLLETNSEE